MEEKNELADLSGHMKMDNAQKEELLKQAIQMRKEKQEKQENKEEGQIVDKVTEEPKKEEAKVSELSGDQKLMHTA